MDTLVRRRLGVLAGLLAALVIVWWPSDWSAVAGGSCDPTQLCVAFLDVGQGDAIFIQSPAGIQMLIDGGRDSAVLRRLSSVMGIQDRTLDYVMATHPDLDHVSGLVDVLDRYQVAHVIRTEKESETDAWRAVEERITTEGSVVTFARRGQQFDLGDGVIATVLFPNRDPSGMESNAASIILRLTYGAHSFLLTGDAPKSIEEYLVLVEGEELKSDVLKVGHHGSRTSTSELFLDHVRPTHAVISAGADNRYGHPHVEVTDALFNAGVTTWSTATHGTVIFESDGQVLITPQ